MDDTDDVRCPWCGGELVVVSTDGDAWCAECHGDCLGGIGPGRPTEAEALDAMRLVPAAEVEELRSGWVQSIEEVAKLHDDLAATRQLIDELHCEKAEVGRNLAEAESYIEDLKVGLFKRSDAPPPYTGPTHAEERAAWDRYAAAALAELSAVPSGAAEWADRMLDERRKRFGGGGKLTAWSEANEHTPLECGHCGTCWVVERVGDEIRGRCLMCDLRGLPERDQMRERPRLSWCGKVGRRHTFACGRCVWCRAPEVTHRNGTDEEAAEAIRRHEAEEAERMRLIEEDR